MHLPGAADTAAFVAYIGRVTLRQGDIVVMDNLAVHKRMEVLRLVVAAGAEVRFLPAYSPDLNPIEKMWNTIKALRGAEARTPKQLDQTISPAFSKITGKDTAGWFASWGYCIISNDLNGHGHALDTETSNHAVDLIMLLAVPSAGKRALNKRRRTGLEIVR